MPNKITTTAWSRAGEFKSPRLLFPYATEPVKPRFPSCFPNLKMGKHVTGVEVTQSHTSPVKTQYYSASSLDGFIATTDNSLDWLLQFGEAEGTGYKDFLAGVGAIAMGSSTYQWLLDHYIKTGTSDQKAWLYTQPTWIFTSRKLASIRNANLHFVQGAVTPVHQQMVKAAQGKNIWIAGGGHLAGQFFDAGLLDELIIQIASVTLGQGLPLLPRLIAFPPLRLTSAQALGEAFAELHYAVPRPSGV